MKVTDLRWAAGAMLCGVHQALCADAAAAFAAPVPLTASHSSTGVMRVVLALLLVLGAIIAAGRLARRVRGVSGGSSSALQVLGQLSLGARERAVLIRVGERQLLIGVAPGNVRTLHVFDQLLPVPQSGSPPDGTLERLSFKAILLKSLGK